MKRSLLTALCFAVVSAFAGAYDIEEFAAKDAGVPDEYIVAEFGGELKVAPAEEVSSLQEGRLVVRQKFVDPFGETEPSYQLYQGGAGDLSSMTAMTAEGVDYSKLVSAKVYEKRGVPADQDVEKVYFDGKSVFAPGLTTAIVFVDGAPVVLKGDAPVEEEAPVAAAEPAPESSASEDEYCDEYDPDCEEEDDGEFVYNTTAPVDNSAADQRDYAANDAASDVGDRFGIADEVRFWTAVGLSALAVTAAVLGVVNHSKSNEAKDSYDELSELNSSIISVCAGDKNCEEIMASQARRDIGNGSYWTLSDLQKRMNENKDTQDSYATARNIWFGISAASIAGAVVLFVW